MGKLFLFSICNECVLYLNFISNNLWLTSVVSLQLPTFYKVVKRTEKTVWLIEFESQLIENDGYGQVGHKIPVDIQKGAVFYKRIKSWKIINDEFQEFAYQRNWGIIEPWDGLAKHYNFLE